jgi:hypothetical protein
MKSGELLAHRWDMPGEICVVGSTPLGMFAQGSSPEAASDRLVLMLEYLWHQLQLATPQGTDEWLGIQNWFQQHFQSPREET